MGPPIAQDNSESPDLITLVDTYLERNKPYTLQGIPNHEQILHCSQRSDIHADIQEGNANQSLVQV